MTVELADATHARLVDLARRRGVEDVSVMVEEAVTRYVDEERRREHRVEAALNALGSLDGAVAEALSLSSRALRESWR